MSVRRETKRSDARFTQTTGERLQVAKGVRELTVTGVQGLELRMLVKWL